MRYQRNIFLAGAAALALVATAGFALAQDSSQNHKAKEPQASTQPMKNHTVGQAKPMGKMQMNAQGEAGKMGKQGAAASGKTTERVGQNTPQTAPKTKGLKHAQRVNRGKKTAKAKMHKRGRYAMRNGMRKHRHYAMHNGKARYAMHKGKARFATRKTMRHRNMTTAQEQNRRLQGLQGNAAMQPGSGGHVNLSAQQRTTIRNTVIDARGAPRVNQAPFNVAVGTAIPRRFHIVPVPRTLVGIDPAWRGLRYFVFEDEVVIVNPYSFRIVAVVPA